MHKDHKVLCVIPARGGSKGIPRKNILPICGKPMIAYSIEQAFKSTYIDRVVVSTDDDEIAAIAKEYNAEVPFMRPAELATDTAASPDVVVHCVKAMNEHGFDADIVVMLHTTAFLRSVDDIDNAIETLVLKNADNVFSVTPSHRNPYFNMVEEADGRIRQVKKGDYPSRQTAPDVYDLNASIYVWWTKVIMKNTALYYENSAIYVMPKERSLDIDDNVDFKIVEFMVKERLRI